jgi:hypothetical protein
MKRITFVFLLFFAASLTYGQQYAIEPQDMEKFLSEQGSLDALKTDGNLTVKEGSCPEGSLISNLPTGGLAYTSSQDANLTNYQSFSGVGEPIGGFTMWAIQAFFSGGAWSACSSPTMEFDIVFYEDNGGLPGAVVHTETHVLDAVADPDVTFGTYTVRRFHTYLDNPVALTSGWFSVVSKNSPTCWSLFINSPGGHGTAGYYDASNVWTVREAPTGFCLLAPLADPGAPAAPTNFTVEPGAMGALTAELSFTMPSETVAGDPLAELTTLNIYRNGDLLFAMPNPIIGGQAVYTDGEITESGNYHYVIAGENSLGEGLTASASAFVGPDVPAAPGNVELVSVGNDGHLTWDAPTEGLNGGYFPGTGLTYTVVRFPGAVEVATDITATEFLDDDIPGMGNYYYTITASNDIGVGGTATSPTVLLGAEGMVSVTVGTAQTIPAFRSPFDLWYNNSLAQAIYYPDEMDGIGGALMGVIYYNNFTSNLPGEEVRIYAGVTEANDMTGGFLGGDIFTLVFQGEVDFPAGENEVMIIFDQPFVYTGGNLVLMTNKMHHPYNGLSGDRFFNTETPDRPARQRTIVSDGTVYDPLNPPTGGTNRNFVPNTTFLFMTAGMGALEGTVVDVDATPLEGVLITIDGTSITAMTDADGEFGFPYLPEGEHSLTASKLGYHDATEAFTIVEDEVTTVSLVMTAVNTVTLSGFVASDEEPTVGLEGAMVHLMGYADYQTTTDASGNFIIEDVFINQTYTIHVTAEAHLPYTAEVVVGEVDLVLDDIILESTDIIEVVIGDGEVLLYMPFNFLWHHSIAQTLYYPEEIGVGGGAITALQYTATFNAPYMDRNVKVWLGETEMDDLADGWVDPSTLQLVYDGTLDFPQGVNEIYIELQDIYIYNGGNLVVYTNKADVEWSGSKQFYGTAAPASNRSRRAQRDNTPIDPMNPGLAGALDQNFPNVTLFINVGGMGHLEGVVTDGTDPLEDVHVKVLGTMASTHTDEDGYYEFPFLLPGTYDIEFSLFGYNTLVVEDIEIEADVEVTLDAVLVPLTQFEVAGTVIGNDGLAIEGAVVVLDGYDNYSATTDADGEFLIEDVYEGEYVLTVTAIGYEEYVNENLDVNADLDLDITLIEIIVPPFGLMVNVEDQDPGNALLMWNTGELYFADSFEDGTFDAWHEFIQGAGTPGETGMAYWHATTNVDGGNPPHGTHVARADWGYNIDTWLISPLVLIEDGEGVVFHWYSSYYWSVSPNPHAELMVKVSTDGGATWAEHWNWQEIGTWSNFTWYETTVDLSAYAGQAVHVAMHLLANDNAVSQIDHVRIGTAPKAGTVALTMPAQVEKDARFVPQGVKSQKAFLGYNVFLNDMTTPVATEIAETEYLFTDLPGGEHTAGVQSVYTSGSSDIVTIDFFVDVTYSVTFEVEDEDGVAITDAEITFDGVEYDAGVYVIPGLSPGTYTYTVSKEGYVDATGEVTVVDDDVVEIVVLEAVVYYDVTFRVHFHYHADFDPATDIVYITGDLLGWAAPGDDHDNQVLEPTNDDPMIYHTTLNLAAGTYHYKYFLNAGWDGGEWAGDPNRTVDVDGDMTVDNVFGNINDPVNVPVVEAGTLLVFPNPATTKLNIVAGDMIREVRMIDMLGQVVYHNTLNADRHEITVAGFKDGIYFIQVVTSKGISTQRVQVTR